MYEPLKPWEEMCLTPSDWLRTEGHRLLVSEAQILEGSQSYKLGDGPDVPGIYFLIVGGRIVYVGLSTYVMTRLVSHWRRRRFERCFYTTNLPEFFLPDFEALYIARHMPEWNNKFPAVPTELEGYL